MPVILTALLTIGGFALQLRAQPSPEDAFPLTRAARGQQRQPNTSAVLAKLKTAVTAEEISAAKAELKSAVAEQFDEHVKQREAQLESLRVRLEALTQELLKRRSAKEQIVDLRVQVLLNEADGLGFAPDEFSDSEGPGDPGPSAGQPAASYRQGGVIVH